MFICTINYNAIAQVAKRTGTKPTCAKQVADTDGVQAIIQQIDSIRSDHIQQIENIRNSTAAKLQPLLRELKDVFDHNESL